MIKKPPDKLLDNPLQYIVENEQDRLDDYICLLAPVDSRGRYLPFDELRHRLPEGLDPVVSWCIIKMARWRQLKDVVSIGEPEKLCKFYLTSRIQQAISEADRHATAASLELMCSKIGEAAHCNYLLNDLFADEAISSSQLEGAATTTKVAQELLKRNRKPRSPDEKMITGNLKMMQFAWKKRDEDLSVDLILSLHQVGVDDIDNDHYTPGVFRTTDDVVIADSDGATVYTPPAVKGLTRRIKRLVKWVNEDHHNADNQYYFHPMVKAMSLHFAIGYEHPFRDGNGRMARALFYWYMFKNDFAAFKYISISTLLKEAPVQYGKSYLYTETDDMDLTYFIDYQCKIFIRAINQFKAFCTNTSNEIERFEAWLWQAGLYKKLNDKQRTIFNVAKSDPSYVFTATEVKENLGCAYNTASNILNGLVELNLFKKEKQGREWVYSILGRKKIQELWEH